MSTLNLTGIILGFPVFNVKSMLVQYLSVCFLFLNPLAKSFGYFFSFFSLFLLSAYLLLFIEDNVWITGV